MGGKSCVKPEVFSDFYLEDHPDMIRMIQAARGSVLQKEFLRIGHPLKDNGDVRPAMTAAATAVGKSGRAEVHPMRWGFDYPAVPGKSPHVFVSSADVHQVMEKASTRPLFEKRRCVVPASYAGVFATLPGSMPPAQGKKYIVQPRGDDMVWMAGIFRAENGLPVFLLLTQHADNGYDVDRIPVFLPKSAVRRWIDPGEDPVQVLGASLTDCIYEPMD